MTGSELKLGIRIKKASLNLSEQIVDNFRNFNTDVLSKIRKYNEMNL